MLKVLLLCLLVLIVTARRVQHRRVKYITSPVTGYAAFYPLLPASPLYQMYKCPPTLSVQSPQVSGPFVDYATSLFPRPIHTFPLNKDKSILIGDIDMFSRLIINSVENNAFLEIRATGSSPRYRCLYSFQGDVDTLATGTLVGSVTMPTNTVGNLGIQRCGTSQVITSSKKVGDNVQYTLLVRDKPYTVTTVPVDKNKTIWIGDLDEMTKVIVNTAEKLLHIEPLMYAGQARCVYSLSAI